MAYGTLALTAWIVTTSLAWICVAGTSQREFLVALRLPATDQTELIRMWDFPEVEASRHAPHRNSSVKIALSSYDFVSVSAASQSQGFVVVDNAYTNGASLTRVYGERWTTSALTRRLSKQCVAVSVDWLSKNVYWIDGHEAANHIALVSYVSKHAMVVHTGLDSPVALGVAPLQGFLFWIESGRSMVVKRSGLTGSDLTTVATGLTNPVAMAIDHLGQTLFWLDQDTDSIEMVGFAGTARRQIAIAATSGRYAGIDLLNDYVIIARNTEDTRVDVISRTTSTRVLSVPLNPQGHPNVTCQGITLMAPERQIARTTTCSADNGGCEHICVHSDLLDSNTCACEFGYDLQSDARSCSASWVEDNFLLIADELSKKLYQMALSTGRVYALPAQMARGPVAVAYDPQRRLVYWSDGRGATIRRSSLDGGVPEIVVQLPSDSVIDGLALDVPAGHLYYTDFTRHGVYMHDEHGEHVVVASGPDAKPRDIVLDVDRRVMYWTDWGQPPHISTANMDGTGAQTLVNTGLVWPNGMAIDFQAQQLYWTDGSTERIERIGLDGLGRTLVLQLPVGTSHMSGLTLDEQFLYYTDWKNKYVVRINRDTLVPAVVGPAFFQNLCGIHLQNSSFINNGTILPSRHSKEANRESTVKVPSTVESTVKVPYTVESTVKVPSTVESTVQRPSTVESTVRVPSTVEYTVKVPSTVESIVKVPSTVESTVKKPSTLESTVKVPSNAASTINTLSIAISDLVSTFTPTPTNVTMATSAKGTSATPINRKYQMSSATSIWPMEASETSAPPKMGHVTHHEESTRIVHGNPGPAVTMAQSPRQVSFSALIVVMVIVGLVVITIIITMGVVKVKKAQPTSNTSSNLERAEIARPPSCCIAENEYAEPGAIYNKRGPRRDPSNDCLPWVGDAKLKESFDSFKRIRLDIPSHCIDWAADNQYEEPWHTENKPVNMPLTCVHTGEEDYLTTSQRRSRLDLLVTPADEDDYMMPSTSEALYEEIPAKYGPQSWKRQV